MNVNIETLFSEFTTLEGLIRNCIGYISAFFTLVFLILSFMVCCSRRLISSGKEKLVLIVSLFTTALTAYYQLLYKKGIIWQLATVSKVSQMLIIALLLLESSVPHLYTERQSIIIARIFKYLFFMYTAAEICLTYFYGFANTEIECVPLIRLVPSVTTFIVANVYLLWSFHMCNKAGSVEGLLRRSIMLQSTSSEDTVYLSNSGYNRRRRTIKTFVSILYIDLWVFAGLEVLLGILASLYKDCIINTVSTNHSIFIFALIPLGVWLLAFILRESSIFYIFFWKCLGSDCSVIVPENYEDDRKSTMVF